MYQDVERIELQPIITDYQSPKFEDKLEERGEDIEDNHLVKVVNNSRDDSGLKVLWLSDSKLPSELKKMVDGMSTYLQLDANDYRYLSLGIETIGSEISPDGLEVTLQDGFEQVVEEIINLKPTIVIVLGAKLTNFMLEKREKLTKIHGKIFNKKISNGEEERVLRWVPCFHPELIQINKKIKEAVILDLDKLRDCVI